MLSMLVTVWNRAEHASVNRFWSIDWVLFLDPGLISPVTTTSCERLRAAMISTVPSCVRPGPHVTIATPTLPVVREYRRPSRQRQPHAGPK